MWQRYSLDSKQEKLEEQHGNNQQQRLGYFCVFCWQRYIKDSKHNAKICREGRILRRLATFSHNNNGEQWPLGNDNLDPLPQVYNDDEDNSTIEQHDNEDDSTIALHNEEEGMNADVDAA